MRTEYGVEIDENLEEIFWMLDDWIDELNDKTKASWNRKGTTKELKNDVKRTEDTWEMIHGNGFGLGGLEELSMALFEESGLMQRQLNKFEQTGQ
jgi:hypothetical protein